MRAIAQKDVAQRNKRQNNLYYAWVAMTNQGAPVAESLETSQIWRTSFLKWIEEYCDGKVADYKIKQSKFFNAELYSEILTTIESYYSSGDLLNKAKL